MAGLLTGLEIKDRALVLNAHDDHFRGASYDVRISKIVTPEGKLEDQYFLSAQGIVHVISEETLRLPLDVSGYALVKTSLCNKGLLALNIGVIDPGYEGKLSSSIINFGKTERFLKTGDTFLRLTFHVVSPVSEKLRPKPSDVDTYIGEKQRSVVEYFSKYFLNITDLVDQTTKEAVGKWRQALLFWVPGMAIVLAVLTFFVNFGVLWSIQGSFPPLDPGNKADAAVSETKALNSRIQALENLIRTTSTSTRDEVQREREKAILERLDRLETLISRPNVQPSPGPNTPSRR
jgi:hypothetical protein